MINDLGAIIEAVPSVQNAPRPWSQVVCPVFKMENTFWNILQDYITSRSFGVLFNAETPK